MTEMKVEVLEKKRRASKEGFLLKYKKPKHIYRQQGKTKMQESGSFMMQVFRKRRDK